MNPRPLAPRKNSFDIDAMMESAHEASGFLKALAHEGRLLILCLLIDGEKSVGEIEDILSLRQPAISQQLARLRTDGLVETRREGKNVFYSLARAEVRDVVGTLHRSFCGAPGIKVAERRSTARAAARAKGIFRVRSTKKRSYKG
jgi:DNA-binding transcriptional ArsR family regulator